MWKRPHPARRALGALVLVALSAGALAACQRGPAASPERTGTPAALGAAASARGRAAATPCADDDDGCRADRLGVVTVGPLREGLSVAEVVALLGEPAQKETPYEEGATGLWRADWTWPARGVRLAMAGNTAEAAPTVHAITVEAPFAGATDRGIALGATEAAVRAAYGEVIDPQGSRPGELVVAGSLYGGAFFGLKDGKVSSIFVGANAE